MLTNADELIKAGEELGIDCQLLEGKDASDYIDFVIDKFKPGKTVGHLAIGSDSLSVLPSVSGETAMIQLAK